LTIKETFIDAGFSELQRDPKCPGHIWVKGKKQKIEVLFDKNFEFATVYPPLDRAVVCIEPQTGPTNAFNLEHKGKFKGLILLDPGANFEANYWIVPTGF